MTQPKSANTAASATVKPKMSRGWRAVLVVSLALNLAVVGLVAGAAFRHNGPPGHHAGKRFDPMVRALGGPARREIGRAMRKGRAEAAGTRQEINAAYADILGALRTDNFDTEALRAALIRKAAALHDVRNAGETALVVHISEMTKSEREALADRLENLRKRRQ